MMRIVAPCLFGTFATVFAQAMPQTVEDLVQQARESIEEGDFEKASCFWMMESSLQQAFLSLVKGCVLSGVLITGEGVVNGYPTDSTMDYFRQALVHDLSLEGSSCGRP